MKIILKKLSLRNFKGILDREITFEGNTNIYGANESGKSTIYTAFNWLLTGKDEFDRKDFEIKNTVLKELNSQSHEVEAVLITEESGIETEHKLKRVYLEKWVKQRGQSQKTFEGHKTEYWWNDVPCNQSEFQAKVDSIIDGKILKLITNPNYFTSLKWDEQRRGLIAIAGEITHGDILTQLATPENTFEVLTGVLASGKKIEEYKAELTAKKSLLKKKAIEYAPRIDEAQRSMPEALDWDAIKNQISGIESEIHGIENTLSNASKALEEKQKGVLELQKQKHAKVSQTAQLHLDIRAAIQSKHSDESHQLRDIEKEIAEYKSRIAQWEKVLESDKVLRQQAETRIAELEGQLVQLRKEWDELNSVVFEFDETACTCPTCKQHLPAHDIEDKRETLRASFNNDIAARKKEKVSKSEWIKSEIAELKSRVAETNATEVEGLIKDAKVQVTIYEGMLHDSIASKVSIEDIELEIAHAVKSDANIAALSEEIDELERKISEANAKIITEDNSELKSQKLQLSIELDDLKKKLSVKDTIERAELRIQQLEKEESENAQEIANIEKQEFEIEQYSKAKMAILEDRVNEMFYHVKWQLFETQVNGAVVETCVCTYNGVPYPTLNTAAKLLAGIDILNTLSNHYNIYAPVFCDNRESVSWIPNSMSQVISLFVSVADKELRIESAAQKTLFV